MLLTQNTRMRSVRRYSIYVVDVLLMYVVDTELTHAFGAAVLEESSLHTLHTYVIVTYVDRTHACVR